MNTRTNKTVLLIILMICLATTVYSAVGTFTFRTSGASDTTEVVDLRYPQKVPEDASVTTDSIADDSITNDKLAEPVSVANGGTGKTTAAEALAALGGASLNGSSTVDFAAKNFTAAAGIDAGDTSRITQVFEDAFIGGLANGATHTTTFVLPSGTTYLLSLGGIYGPNTSKKPYLAVLFRQGTATGTVELTDADNLYTVNMNASYAITITNGSGETLNSRVLMWRLN